MNVRRFCTGVAAWRVLVGPGQVRLELKLAGSLGDPPTTVDLSHAQATALGDGGAITVEDANPQQRWTVVSHGSGLGAVEVSVGGPVGAAYTYRLERWDAGELQAELSHSARLAQSLYDQDRWAAKHGEEQQ